MHKLVDCVIGEIVKFIKENQIKFIKIKNVRDRHGNPKKQYKCEDWLTTELYFRFHNIFHTIEPEPAPSLELGKERFDIFIEDDKEHLWIEAKERFNGGDNQSYLNDGSLIEAICKFIKYNECKELLFFSTYDKPINKIIKNKNDLEKKLKEKLKDLEEKRKLLECKEIKVEPTEENKNKFIIKITKEGEKEKNIEILLEPRGEEIKLCNTETLYLHFYIITKL